MEFHSAVVVAFCLLGVLIVYRDLVELYVDWYSGTETPISRFDKGMMYTRIVVVFAAIVIVMVDLFHRAGQ